MDKFIALFEYSNINYFIRLIGNNTIDYYKEDIKGKRSNELTIDEIDMLNTVFNSLRVDILNSVYYDTKKVGKNNYNIYYDNSIHNFFWIPKNNKYSVIDNIILNFQYNNELGIVFGNIDNNYFKNNKDFFKRFINIKGKLVLVLVSASLSMSMLSGCKVSEDKLSKASVNSVLFSKNEIKDILADAHLKYENEREAKGYSFDDIRDILANNENLSIEEKALIYKLQFVFDEYHAYMNLDVIKERLATLGVEYQKVYFSSSQGHYDYTNNLLVLNGTDFDDVSKAAFLHEFFHILQDEIQGYGFFSCELSNEFFTREVLIRLYKEGLLDKKEFLHSYYKEKYISGELDISSDNEWLYYINLTSGFSVGYSDYMGIYNVLAQIIPKETLLTYQFNPLRTEELKMALLNIVGSKTPEEVERANNLINAINDLRQYDVDNNCYIYLKDEGEIFSQLDYYFKIAKGKSIGEDLSLCVRLENENYRDFGIFSYINDANEFLQDKGIYYLGMGSSYATFSMDKTVLSDDVEESIIIYKQDGELKVLVINQELENEYVSYYSSSIKK